MAPDIACDPDAAYAADSRANLLDGRHHGEGKKHRPEHAVAKLRPDLRIRRNPARIVVCRSGDQARAELPQDFFDS